MAKGITFNVKTSAGTPAFFPPKVTIESGGVVKTLGYKSTGGVNPSLLTGYIMQGIANKSLTDSTVIEACATYGLGLASLPDDSIIRVYMPSELDDEKQVDSMRDDSDLWTLIMESSIDIVRQAVQAVTNADSELTPMRNALKVKVAEWNKTLDSVPTIASIVMDYVKKDSTATLTVAKESSGRKVVKTLDLFN